MGLGFFGLLFFCLVFSDVCLIGCLFGGSGLFVFWGGYGVFSGVCLICCLFGGSGLFGGFVFLFFNTSCECSRIKLHYTIISERQANQAHYQIRYIHYCIQLW